MSTAVVIVAAGAGSRMGGTTAKQWQVLAGRPVLVHALERFRSALPQALRVLVLPRGEALARGDEFPGWTCVDGGLTRSGSVRAGLEALVGQEVRRVLIHDAARPLVPAAVIHRVHQALLDGAPGAAPGLTLTDALWRVEDGRIRGIAPRNGLWRAQTPQGFAFDPLLAAHRAHPGGADDDVAVALAAEIPVTAVAGDEDNFKLTVPADMDRARARLEEQSMGSDVRTGQGFDVRTGQGFDVRTGQGFDVHAFGPGDHVTLCGVDIPHEAGLAGHSDADVGIHALCDAIYGALAEGDIGRHFPPSEARWRGADSMVFLEHAGALATERGWRIANVDVTLICERPKIGPHAAAMQARMAPPLGVGADRVSVKATTSERLGFTGRGEGIAALATATLVRP